MWFSDIGQGAGGRRQGAGGRGQGAEVVIFFLRLLLLAAGGTPDLLLFWDF